MADCRLLMGLELTKMVLKTKRNRYDIPLALLIGGPGKALIRFRQ
jgi:hypothetical protein